MKIEKIEVKVTYRVGLGGLTAPKKVMKQLEEIAESGEVDFATTTHDEARDWILKNIKERDCYESTFEIEELQVPVQSK